MKYGIEEIKDAVVLVSSVSSFISVHLADDDGDGKPDLGLDDLFALLKQGPKLLQEYKEIDPALLVKEAQDLDGNEQQALALYFREKFDLPNDSLEVTIEKGFSLLLKGLGLIDEAIEFFKGLKK